MDHSFMYSSCVFFDEVLVCPRAPTGSKHLLCPAGTNAPSSYCEAPCKPRGILLLFSSFLYIKKNSLCVTDIKSKAPWQQHPEVLPAKHFWSEFNWREKEEEGRKWREGGRVKKNKKGETQVVSSNQHELQVGLLCFISWFCCQIFVPHYWTWTGVSLFF